jgi:hypothetical protein
MYSEERESRKLLVQILQCRWSVCYHCNQSLGRLSSKVERKNCALHLIQAKGNKRCKPLHGETMSCLLETPSFLKNRTQDANPGSCTWEIAKKFKCVRLQYFPSRIGNCVKRNNDESKQSK